VVEEVTTATWRRFVESPQPSTGRWPAVGLSGIFQRLSQYVTLLMHHPATTIGFAGLKIDGLVANRTIELRARTCHKETSQLAWRRLDIYARRVYLFR
jgi:hypothetical protein